MHKTFFFCNSRYIVRKKNSSFRYTPTVPSDTVDFKVTTVLTLLKTITTATIKQQQQQQQQQ